MVSMSYSLLLYIVFYHHSDFLKEKFDMRMYINIRECVCHTYCILIVNILHNKKKKNEKKRCFQKENLNLSKILKISLITNKIL